ncbi:MAG: flagellar biosynthesis protein FlhF [Planctomycetota bacterium]|nr:flagellar biosynthesis protein FlhF [Planctomycetota bacterium]
MYDQIARFEAPTMNEALEKIRTVFGDDGMIVGTRTFRRGGVLGVGGHEIVEVYVADTRSRIENVRRQSMNRGREGGAGSTSAQGSVKGGVKLPGYEVIGDTLTQLRDEIKDLLDRTPEKGGFSHPFLSECYDLLISREVEPRVADGLVREIANLRLPTGYPTPARVTAVVRTQLAKLFVENAPVDPDIKPRIICLVGPTGVGKTTTIAKLAARAKVNERRKVGLITLDTFRIAAVDQLQRYADIIGIALEVVSDSRELEEAIGRFREEGQDVVFVDTAGRSHRDELKMAELKEFLAVIPGAEVHLVLSCTTHAKTIDSVAERFSAAHYHRLILTKIDESVSMGALISSLLRVNKPVSFVTDGQNVPDDIMVGAPERLAELVLKNQTL